MTAAEEVAPAKARRHRPKSPLMRTLRAALIGLRGEIRASELWLVGIAAAVGAAGGLLTLAARAGAHLIQEALYGQDFDQQLSPLYTLPLSRVLVLPLGGLILGVVTWLWVRRRPKTIVDPVEANALHGGRMSGRDSLFLGVQSVISNGFGASVGLEAAYAQLGAALASLSGGALNLRRSDLRTLVGAGAGAGIAAAFGAPLTGAFYAFEIIIGSYTLANIAPVVTAALAGALVTRLLKVEPLVIHTVVTDSMTLSHYLLFAALGVICALFGVLVMRMVGWTEQIVSVLPGPRWLRPALGGLLLAAMAWNAPQTLSAGHGALHVDLALDLAAGALVFLIITKAVASVVSLGFGFRGGLFFASLYLGALLGRLFVVGLTAIDVDVGLDPMAGSLVGMGAMAVAVIGGPLTMSFLVLETTGDFGLTAATLTASIIASVIVREIFGYSFSTWRLHLRGETIRSAHDVGGLRTLTAGRMMRADVPTIAASAPLLEFRRRFPLGSARRIVALDPAGHYAGVVRVAAIYAETDEKREVAASLINREDWLRPEMTIKEIMRVFDRTESDELAVLDDRGDVLGVLTEAYATRRYAEELEKARRDLVGGE
ncbi:MAG TPA: chloride channel protein [Caulobacteraceae bacterium]